jgi:hypothetical protein
MYEGEKCVGEIVIQRVKAPRQDRLRDYKVFVDGVKVATVSNGAQVRIPVVDGEHVVRLGIDWCSSNSLQVKVLPDRVVMLDCGPKADPWTALAYITFLRRSYLWLREHP